MLTVRLAIAKVYKSLKKPHIHISFLTNTPAHIVNDVLMLEK